MRRDEQKLAGREGGKIVILPKSTFTQIPNNKTSKKKTHKQTTQLDRGS